MYVYNKTRIATLIIAKLKKSYEKQTLTKIELLYIKYYWMSYKSKILIWLFIKKLKTEKVDQDILTFLDLNIDILLITLNP